MCGVTKEPHPAAPKCPENRCWVAKGAQLFPKGMRFEVPVVPHRDGH